MYQESAEDLLVDVQLAVKIELSRMSDRNVNPGGFYSVRSFGPEGKLYVLGVTRKIVRHCFRVGSGIRYEET